MKTVGFHFTTWPNRNIREISSAMLEISITFLVPAWPGWVLVTMNYEKMVKPEEEIQKLAKALKQSPCISMITDTDGNIEFVNSKFTQVTGYTAEEVIGKHPRFLQSAKNSETDYNQIWETVKKGDTWCGELHNKKKNGDCYWEFASIAPVKNSEGVITDFVKIAEDITRNKQINEEHNSLNLLLEQLVSERTAQWKVANEKLQTEIRERKQMERVLRESEERYKDLFENANDLIQSVTPEGKFLYVNNAWRRTLGYSTAEISDLSLLDIIHPDSQAHCMEILRRLISEGNEQNFEAVFIAKDGRKIVVEGSVNCRFKNGKPVATRGIFRDITERKRVNEELRRKNTFLNILQVAAVAANEAVEIKDAFMPVLEVICFYTGWEIGHAYLLSKDNVDLLEPTDIWWFADREYFKSFRSTSQKMTFRKGIGLPGRVLEDGKPHWIKDVTKDGNFLRTEIAKELNIKSGIAFPVLVGTSVVAALTFFAIDVREPDKQLMNIMAKLGAQLGRAVERIQSEEDRRLLLSAIKQSSEGLAVIDLNGKLLFVNKAFASMHLYTPEELQGKHYHILYAPEQIAAVEAAERQLMAENDFNGEILHLRQDGTLFPTLMHNSFIKDETGKRIAVVSAVVDITERKKWEDAFLNLEKMKAMGIMTSGVAHEFNNILAIISSNAQLLEEVNLNNKELVSMLRTICRAADDGAEIVNRMYEFTNVNQDISRYIIVDFKNLIRQVIEFTKPRWKEMAQACGITYKIVRTGIKTKAPVLCNPSELREVIVNIVNNALDAMPDGGVLTFDLQTDQGNVSLTVSDTGNGMSEEVKKKVFDPFFTTKSPEGTGLGMSVSFGIVSRHGGKIDVESKLGKGSSINIRLPITARYVQKKESSTIARGIEKAKNLNVLVVDDEYEIMESLRRLFSKEGYRVSCAGNGADAIKMLGKGSFDLLICDLVMPNVTGRDVIKSLDTLKKRPRVGILTAWNYTGNNAMDEDLRVDFVINKPFKLSKLRSMINTIFTDNTTAFPVTQGFSPD